MNGGSRIRTPDQRLRIFVSSTLAELAQERLAVREAIERLQLTPVLFELGARPHPPRDLYRAYLEQSQVFVGIYWQSYGWVAPGEKVSGLEDEYSLSPGMPRLLYVKTPAAERELRLDQLLHRIQEENTASYRSFRTPEELALLVGGDLALLLSERFMTAPIPTPQTGDRPHHNLPVRLSSFVDREAELAKVKRTLAGSRLVTLTGVGGSGKTRLAGQAATDLLNEYADGVWLVDLTSISEPSRVSAAVAIALAVAEDPRRSITETLADHLLSKRLLLVIDNCEHVLAECADLAARLLTASPGLAVLATSREGLAVPGEVVIPVESLAVPGDGTDAGALANFAAVRLFLERAQAIRADFHITQDNAEAVMEIVGRLDGIPLALELAAARIKLLSAAQIATRLSDRFRLLTDGARTALPRQRTLRAAMDWSYDLLDEAEQTLLRRVSVIMGNFTLDAAEAVCGADALGVKGILDVIGGLVDKSLVVVVQAPGGNRYRLLETVRQYGLERLDEAGESDATHTAHRDWCWSLVEAAAHHIRGGREQARWLEVLESQHDDLHAALEWSHRRGDATASLRIAVGAAWFWYLHGHWDEARRFLEYSTALDGAEPTLKSQGFAWAAVFAWRREDLDRARQCAEKSLQQLAGTGDEAEGLSLLALTLVAISAHDYPTAEQLGRRALEVFRTQDHTWGVSTSLLVLSRIASNRRSGMLDELLHESGDLVATGSDMWARAHVLTLQGYEAFRALDLDLARDLHTTAHALAVDLGDLATQAENLLALAHVYLLRGANAEAERALVEARSLVDRLQGPHELGHVDQGFAVLAISRGDVTTGQALLDDVARLFRELHKAPMGSAHALGLAEVYRRADHPLVAAALLRHALSLLDQTQSPAEYAQACADLAALEGEDVRPP